MTIDMSSHGAVPELTLGWRLQMALAHAEVNAGEMAIALEVSRNTVSRWLNDHGRPPKSIYLREWAFRCAVDYTWLATGHHQAGPDDPGRFEPPVGVEPTACRLQGSGIAMVLSLPRFRQDDVTEREAA